MTPMPQKNAPINIRQVGNGFVVTADSRVDKYEVRPDEDTQVFQTLAALTEFLAAHFTHRCTGVISDPLPTQAAELADMKCTDAAGVMPLKPGADGRL